MARTAALLFLFILAFSQCTEDDVKAPMTISETGNILILNEGNFQRGNASLSLYDPIAKEVVEQEIFISNTPVDVLQSARVLNDTTLLVVSNNTNEILILNRKSFALIKKLQALGSPRYTYVHENKLYISDLYANALLRIDLITEERDQISFPGAGAEIEMIDGDLAIMAPDNQSVVFVAPSPFQIITAVDQLGRVTEAHKLNEQTLLVVSSAQNAGEQGNLWQLSLDSGVWEADTIATFANSETGLYPRVEANDQYVYCLQRDLHRIKISELLSNTPLEKMNLPEAIYYGLGLAPTSGDIYIADAKGFIGNGDVIRFDSTFTRIDSFSAGPLPSGFVF